MCGSTVPYLSLSVAKGLHGGSVGYGAQGISTLLVRSMPPNRDAADTCLADRLAVIGLDTYRDFVFLGLVG